METHEKTIQRDRLQAGFKETYGNRAKLSLESQSRSFLTTDIHPLILLAYGGVADGLVNHFDASFQS